MSFKNFILLATLAASTPAPATTVASVEEVAEIATRAIERIDHAHLADCDPADADRFPKATLVCGSFRGSFSALKFQLESNLGLQEFEPLVKPRDAWTLRGGAYSRDLDVLGRAVTFGFQEPTGAIRLVIGDELPPEPKAKKKKDEDDSDKEKEDEDKDKDQAEDPPPSP